MTWTAADIPDLTGTVALVTGANSGLGFESTKALAAKGAHVIMAARNRAKAEEARTSIVADIPSASLELIDLDLGSLDSVRAAADAVAAAHPRVGILLNNAGLMAMPESRTSDGFEMQFGVNHLGHWALTARLLPNVIAGGGRVVTVTSTAHHMGWRVDPDNVNMEGNYNAWKAYGRAKLANFHFGIGLQWELERRGLNAASLIAHPGLSHTNLQVATAEAGAAGGMGDFFKDLAAKRGMSAARGALPQLRAATDLLARGGEFYGPRWMNTGDPVRLPIVRRIGLKRAVDTLWKVSERSTGEELRFE
jgi:NAD(P)-dependent dehydrogenase (short-subunit alcohol dehydrogenase family)